MKREGDRLRQALQEMGLTQADAAKKSGIKQGWISSMISGERAMGREDLRRFALLGISADYLLLGEGHPRRAVAREPGTLLSDLSSYIADELMRRCPPPASVWKLGPYDARLAWDVDAALALEMLMEVATEQAYERTATHETATWLHEQIEAGVMEAQQAFKLPRARVRELRRAVFAGEDVSPKTRTEHNWLLLERAARALFQYVDSPHAPEGTFVTYRHKVEIRDQD